MEKKGRCQERNHPYSVSWYNDDENNSFLEGKTGKGEGWERGEGKIEFKHMYLHLVKWALEFLNEEEVTFTGIHQLDV